MHFSWACPLTKLQDVFCAVNMTMPFSPPSYTAIMKKLGIATKDVSEGSMYEEANESRCQKCMDGKS